MIAETRGSPTPYSPNGGTKGIAASQGLLQFIGTGVPKDEESHGNRRNGLR